MVVGNGDALRLSARVLLSHARAQTAIRKQLENEMVSTAMLTLADGRIEDVKSEHVLAAARTNDTLALELIQETAYYMGWGIRKLGPAYYMGWGIANLVNILNPDIVLLGTIAVAASDLLLDPIRETVLKFAMTRPAEAVKIAPAQLGEALGDLAAVALVV